MKGAWKNKFNNNNPIVVELGCGKGEYSVTLGKMNPEVNYIGIDIKGARIYSGASLDMALAAQSRIRCGFRRTLNNRSDKRQVFQ